VRSLCYLASNMQLHVPTFHVARRYDNTTTQQEFLKLGVLTEIISILKSAKLSKKRVEPENFVRRPGSNSDMDSDDAGHNDAHSCIQIHAALTLAFTLQPKTTAHSVFASQAQRLMN